MLDRDPHMVDGASFGPFRLSVAERLLEKDGVPLNLGGRALDILIALVERAGEVVSKKDLVARAWPDVTVDEGSLRFHIAALRKALGDGKAGARYLTNVAGRGYCLVAPVSRADPAPPPIPEPMAADQFPRLPPRRMRLLGRDETIQAVVANLRAHRFVTIVGPGGIGKTTVAISVAQTLMAPYDGAVCFVDLGSVSDPAFVPGAISSALAIPVHSVDLVAGLIGFLRDRRLLLVLDSCEHVIETVAALAERIFEEAPHVDLLATSRESLRIENEQVHRLAPLGCPPEDDGLSAADILAFPAVQLFVERVSLGCGQFEMSDRDAPIIAEISRKLDGIALAIELVAGRVDAYGIQGIAALLNDRFGLLWQGRRTAAPRHQTLSATLDWSYDLLSEVERLILRRLSVFVGTFTLESVQAVVTEGENDGACVVEAIASLVAKSLVTADLSGLVVRYRLLNTTRAYALGKLVESGELDVVARRHAMFTLRIFEHAGAGAQAPASAGDLAAWGELIGDVRAALEWSFCASGDLALATALTTAAAPLFLKLSLLAECHDWTRRAVAALDDAARGTGREMQLQASLGLSLMFAKGNSEDVRVAFSKGLKIAEELGDVYCQMQFLGGLHIFSHRIGDFQGALALAERSDLVAARMADPVGKTMADCMLGISLHFIGNHREAHRRSKSALSLPIGSQHIGPIRFGMDHTIRARSAWARTLWLLGYPDESVKMARMTVEQAELLEHPVTLCIALIWTTPVYLGIGDWASAEENIERFMALAERHSLTPHNAVGLGLRGELSIRRGEPELGIRLLRECLATLHVDRYAMRMTLSLMALAEALAIGGESDEALRTIDKAIANVEQRKELVNLPETLRIRGEILASKASLDLAEAETCLIRSRDVARAQSALSVELRAAMNLARLWSRQGRHGDALQCLAEVYGRFSEGFETADLKAARLLLAALQDSLPGGWPAEGGDGSTCRPVLL